jgi:CrcB protein
MVRFLLVGAGGALGSLARYLVSVLAARVLGSDFPFGTLLVNLVGAFLIGFVQHVALSSAVFSLDLRLFLTVGILGGFTTYSAFSYESIRMLHDGAWLQAIIYVGLTTMFALALCGIGVLLARSLVGT